MWIIKKQLYDNEDVQKMLNYLHYNGIAKHVFSQEIKGYSPADKQGMLYAIDEAWYEAFDRYDSAVCDSFIRSFEKCFLKEEGIAQYEVLMSANNQYKVIDYDDGAVDILARNDLIKAIKMGIEIKGFVPSKMAKHL